MPAGLENREFGWLHVTAAAVVGLIIPGKGRGGKIGLPATGVEPLKVFVSYAHEDQEIRIELEKHLGPLVRRRLITIWSDRKIIAGQEWDKAIFEELEAADIILLLVSIDFINSDFCYERELERALERHDAGEASVIAVLLRNCTWKSTLFSKLQATPKGPRPRDVLAKYRRRLCERCRGY